MEKKEKAIERMKILDIANEAILKFEKDGEVVCSDFNGILRRLTSDEREKVQKWEKQNKCVAYHVLKTKTAFGDLLNILFVSDYKEDWNLEDCNLKRGLALAYVINLNFKENSEMGTISLRKIGQNLIRIA